MDLSLSAEELAFRGRARRFLVEHLPERICSAQRLTPTVYTEIEISREWHCILAQQGWAAPTWPEAFGGPGWSIVERYLWQAECARAGAPLTSPIGLSLVGPVVMQYGTEQQQSWVLPGILSGKDYWCQGFSEPSAGSDLAALRTRATVDGEDYIVTGSKIWTTHAHYANWMAALVRTGDSGRRQEGISFLLIDMAARGITVRPIRTIGGDHEINEVFFDDVRVPRVNRVGEEGQGWEIAKFLLEFERGGDIAAPELRAQWAEIVSVASMPTEGGAARIDDPDVELEIAQVGVDLDALELLELRLMAVQRSGERPGAMASMLKLRVSQMQQAVAELAVTVLGVAALRWEPNRPLYRLSDLDAEAGFARVAMPRHLNCRANTIFGGSAEIQRSLIARMLLTTAR